MLEAQEQDHKRLEAQRARQRRDAARGCLIILVLEGAGLLAGALWVIASRSALWRSRKVTP